jgi:hypothetical protein
MWMQEDQDNQLQLIETYFIQLQQGLRRTERRSCRMISLYVLPAVARRGRSQPTSEMLLVEQQDGDRAGGESGRVIPTEEIDRLTEPAAIA